MSWQTTGTVGEFLAAAGEFLHAERARNTVMLTVTEAMRVKAASEASEASKTSETNETNETEGVNGVNGYQAALPLFGWWRPDRSNAVRGAFMHTPPFPVMLSAMAGEAAATLAGRLAEAGRSLAGVNAAEQSAQTFAAAWRERTGMDARVHRRMRLFRLGDLAWPAPAPDGEARIVNDADRNLLLAWFDAFAREVNDPPNDHAAAVDDRLSYGGITIWEVGGVPVSIAGVTRTVGGMVRVGPVYTPPELRGHGYAGAATATVSRAALDAGTTDVLLYTDLANPTSNALYQRIGYRPVEDRVLLTFG